MQSSRRRLTLQIHCRTCARTHTHTHTLSISVLHRCMGTSFGTRPPPPLPPSLKPGSDSQAIFTGALPSRGLLAFCWASWGSLSTTDVSVRTSRLMQRTLATLHTRTQKVREVVTQNLQQELNMPVFTFGLRVPAMREDRSCGRLADSFPDGNMSLTWSELRDPQLLA